jgi:transposase
MAKHFALAITDDNVTFERKTTQINAEAALDGIYVLHTSLEPETLDAASTVKTYKQLAQVERAFRCIKTVDIEVRPIHHRWPHRVRAHVFLCMLAYYLEWHMRQALKPILFDDHAKAAAEAARTSIVAKAKRSRFAERKAALTKHMTDRPSTASARCSATSPPSPATPWRWSASPTPPSCSIPNSPKFRPAPSKSLRSPSTCSQ